MTDTPDSSKKPLAMSRDDQILKSLKRYFYDKEEADIMVDILRKKKRGMKTKLSLRVLDWFVTNFAKKNNTVYEIPSPDNEKDTIVFNVYLQYWDQLKAYGKPYFDPFKRVYKEHSKKTKRFRFKYNRDGDKITTTISQLNFFRWAISNKIIDYVTENIDEIFEDMKTASQKQKQETKEFYENNPIDESDDEESLDSDSPSKKIRKPRQKLSVSATKKVNKYNVKVTLRFN
jgi:hypothetical protein